MAADTTENVGNVAENATRFNVAARLVGDIIILVEIGTYLALASGFLVSRFCVIFPIIIVKSDV